MKRSPARSVGTAPRFDKRPPSPRLSARKPKPARHIRLGHPRRRIICLASTVTYIWISAAAGGPAASFLTAVAERRNDLHFPLMRLVDKSLGTQLCRLVALGLWLCRKHVRHVDHPPSPEPDTVRNILVMKFLGMGSILQATPLFQALRQRYPQARITLLTFHSNRALEPLGIGVDEVVTVNTASQIGRASCRERV